MAKLVKMIEDTGEGGPEFYIEEVQPANLHDFTLEELQTYVEGNIDVIDLTGGKSLVVNDEFLINGSRPNPIASALYGGMICGSVVICDSAEVE